MPSYGQKLNGNVALTQQVWDDTAATLQPDETAGDPDASGCAYRDRQAGRDAARGPRRSTIWRCKSKLDSEQREDHGLPFLRYLTG
ncbi:hypothetical protein LNP05_16405 [Klebsiella pneumoniae subsp. pneumoniae]|nr:hypothetical protein [Klebsiella pneumoniae subsp. pneumoniae]